MFHEPLFVDGSTGAAISQFFAVAQMCRHDYRDDNMLFVSNT